MLQTPSLRQAGSSWAPALAAVLFASCTGAPDGGGAGASGPLEASLMVEPDTAPSGAAVHLVLEVANVADTAVTLDISTGQRFDFALRKEGEEVALWSADKMFTQVLGSETFAPSATRTFEADMSAPPVTGEYMVVGWLTSGDAVARDSTSLVVVEAAGGAPESGR